MKRMMIVLALCALLPVQALAAQISMTQMEQQNDSSLVVFSVGDELAAPGEAPDALQMALSAQIEARFQPQKAMTASTRGSVVQEGSLYQDENAASMALIWRGEQIDGTEGCSAMGLTVNLNTGEEIFLEQLFADPDAAFARMEEIIADDVLDGMSDYMEYADLLPMPREQYSFDAYGLTVYWPEDRYRWFDGTCGSVTFYWYELADFIAEGSPVYALAHPDVPYHPGAIETACLGGEMTPMLRLELGVLLGDAARDYRLADPDYTTDALVYPLERVRGFSLEIPKYAQTQEEMTPISAIRASRISLCGLLTTGKTTDLEILSLLGEPAKEIVYDEDDAFDAMLEPGISLLYEISGRVLQLHVDEAGVLSCVILRGAMPESLY